jgi:tetratricopeptide (TPR) repeat protein
MFKTHAVVVRWILFAIPIVLGAFSTSEYGELGVSAISPGLSPSGSLQQFDPVNVEALSPACKEANSKALGLLQEARFADAGKELSEFLGWLDHSPENALCSGVTQSNLAYAFRDAGRDREAEHAALRSVESFEISLGFASPWLCRPLLLLVRLSLEQGRLRDASAILSRVESLPLSRHEDLALVKGLRGNLLEQSQNLRHALIAYRESIAEWEKAGEGSSPDIVPELSNLALAYEKSGDSAQALATLERAWHIVDKPSGDANTRVRLLLAFAVTLAKQRDNRRTEGYFQQAMALLNSVPPPLRQMMGKPFIRHIRPS